MGKSTRVKGIVLTACIVAGLGVWVVPDSAQAGPLVFDKEIGHYKDLSYKALSDEGLSFAERTSLFGGETVHYGELTAKQRQAKQKELDGLLKKIDMKLVNQCDADIRKWLDQQIKMIPPSYADNKEQYSYRLRGGAVAFFRAYEIFGDKKYLDAGLKCADLILKAQSPKGHWGGRSASGGVMRIQDGTTTGPFWAMLYAYKVSGDKKYLDSARRCADVLLSAQSNGGGWPDQWIFRGGSSGSSGVRNGAISFNDGATNDPFQIMVAMYNITKDKKYIAKLGNLGPFIAKANIGEGKVVGWAEQYHGDGRPTRARRYEIEVCYPASITRAIGPLLTWLYLMDGDEAHMDLLRKAYATFETLRRRDLKPENWKCWQIINDAHRKKNGPDKHMRPGWAPAYLPDGSNSGWVTGYAMFPHYPITTEMRKKYGGLIHSEKTLSSLATSGPHIMRVGETRGSLHKWAKDILAGKPAVRTGDGAARGNSLSEVRRALLEHKRGGHKGLLRYYKNPTKYTPDQYLQARVDAAKRALDRRNLKLAANPDKKGILAIANPNGFIAQKGRWHGGTLLRGTPISKWGKAFGTTGKWGSVAWYQWQLVYDTLLAQGKISADAAARGGRGLETVAWHTHLDTWDVLGEWGMATHEMENYFDVPITKK